MKNQLLAGFMGRCVKTIGVDNSIFSSKYLFVLFVFSDIYRLRGVGMGKEGGILVGGGNKRGRGK